MLTHSTTSSMAVSVMPMQTPRGVDDDVAERYGYRDDPELIGALLPPMASAQRWPRATD
jgi:hypothetical protein